MAHDLLTSEEAASTGIVARLPAAWCWCGTGRSLQCEDGAGCGQPVGVSGELGAPCGDWAVSWAHLSPGARGGQGESKEQSQGGRANPRRCPGGRGPDGFSHGGRGGNMLPWFVVLHSPALPTDSPCLSRKGTIKF